METKTCPFCGTAPAISTNVGKTSIRSYFYIIKCESSDCPVRPAINLRWSGDKETKESIKWVQDSWNTRPGT